jgi:mRNA-degrading endonuclease RelE of RelBE toxin-antitoxin system
LNWRIELTAEAESQLERLSDVMLDRVAAAFDALELDPAAGKALVGDWSGCRSYRVGQHRVIYSLAPDDGRIVVYAIAKRSRVYQKRR